MSWLSRLRRPKGTSSQTTTLVFHRNDSAHPIIHNVRGLWRDEALFELLETLVQEHYHPQYFRPVCEVLWQDGTKVEGVEIQLAVGERGT